MKKARPRTEEVQRLVHELAVQQLELERQNEEIRNAQHELEAERDRVADLYQLAPVAHLTLDRIGNDDAAFAEMIIAGSVAGRRFQAQ